MFRALLDMAPACDVCDLIFEREPGYFMGAMVVSYTLATGVYGAATLLLWWLTGGSAEIALVLAAVPFLLTVPFIFRYSRVIWMYLDQAFDPSK